MTKDTLRKAFESWIGEILESQQPRLGMCVVVQTKFYLQQSLIRSFVQSFKPFCKNLQTSKNSGT